MFNETYKRRNKTNSEMKAATGEIAQWAVHMLCMQEPNLILELLGVTLSTELGVAHDTAGCGTQPDLHETNKRIPVMKKKLHQTDQLGKLHNIKVRDRLFEIIILR